jgi:septal ring factor EnvC (AmiA/AmiB activator)
MSKDNKDKEIYEQEIERLNRIIELKEDNNKKLMDHIQGLDRQIARLIELDNDKDDFILKIRKELISRL